NLQPGKPLEGTAGDEPRGRGHGLQRKANHIPEVIVLDAADIAGVLRVEKKRHVQPVSHREHRRDAGIIEVPAVDVRAYGSALELELRDGALELARGAGA